MILKALSSARRLLSNQKLLIVLAVTLSSFWMFARISDLNPIVMQDEWVYVVSSTLDSPWDSSPSYDFGNYLFNFIYSSTSICGDAFYTCGKILNLVFISCFALIFFSIASKFTNFSVAIIVMVAIYLSPISIYSSMFLPESLYFAVIATTFWFVVRFLETENRRDLVFVGASLGLAALAKPHALFIFGAFGIFLLIWEASRKSPLKKWLLSGAMFVAPFFVARLFIGLAIAGPKALNLFGSYGATEAVVNFVAGAGSPTGKVNDTIVGAGGPSGAGTLFLPQLSTHLVVVGVLLGGVLMLLLLAAFESVRKSDKSIHSSLAVLALVCFGVLLVATSLYAGWITGLGSDHTSRVLLRYYEYLVPLALLPALGFLFAAAGYREASVFSRISAGSIALIPMIIGLGGFFQRRDIQLADAPSLVGFVAGQETMIITGSLLCIGILALIFFPRASSYVLVGTIAASMTVMGYVTQTQFSAAGSEASAADKAGKIARAYLTENELQDLVVLSTSKFEGRKASFWMQSDNDLYVLERGATLKTHSLESGARWVLVLGFTSLEGESVVRKIQGPGFELLEISPQTDFVLSDPSPLTPVEILRGFEAEFGGLLWTSGSEASIIFKHPLPAQATLSFEMAAMPDIVEQTIYFQLGDSRSEVVLNQAFSTSKVTIEFSNSSPSDEIKIVLQSAKAATQVGVGKPAIGVGLGIGRISVLQGP